MNGDLIPVRPLIRGEDLFRLHSTYGLTPDEVGKAMRRFIHIVSVRNPEYLETKEYLAILEILDGFFLRKSARKAAIKAFLDTFLYDEDSGQKLCTLRQAMRLEGLEV